MYTRTLFLLQSRMKCPFLCLSRRAIPRPPQALLSLSPKRKFRLSSTLSQFVLPPERWQSMVGALFRHLPRHTVPSTGEQFLLPYTLRGRRPMVQSCVILLGRTTLDPRLVSLATVFPLKFNLPT